MLNKDNMRELAYVVKIGDIVPIEGRDRVECAMVGGWHVMVRKGEFQPGDLGIYFEVDSRVPAREPFEFLAAKDYKIKIQKYKTPSGHFWSEGLLMSANDFGWKYTCLDSVASPGTLIQYFTLPDGTLLNEGDFLTERLDIIYAAAEDNTRKARSVDKYKVMAQRHGKLFSKQPFRWLMKRDWGKKLLFVFFGKKKDKKTTWPEWVAKTDEERAQNIPGLCENKEEWVVTEKIDGSSTTFTMHRGHMTLFGMTKPQFYVCSRNVVFDKPDKPCYYDSNIYLEMAEQYKIKEFLEAFLEARKDVTWVTLQGETYGEKVQVRNYSLPEIHSRNSSIPPRAFMGFNFITDVDGRWNSRAAADYCSGNGIPWVPIINEHYVLPDTVDELLDYATGDSILDGGMREGFVFRSQDGQRSFKAVSREFILKYHS